MSFSAVPTVLVQSAGFHYPAAHWERLRSFVPGMTLAPDLDSPFDLAADIWEGWQHSVSPRKVEAARYRYRFDSLRSFIKPYAKCVCYQMFLAKTDGISTSDAALPHALRRFDTYFVNHGITELHQIASRAAFKLVWDAMVRPPPGWQPGELLPAGAVRQQEVTRQFWCQMQELFGAPLHIPTVAPHMRRNRISAGLDEERPVPDAVFAQFVNVLALHRDGVQKLNPFDHARLCVTCLAGVIGRRVSELLGAPRGQGKNGPLRLRPRLPGEPPAPAEGTFDTAPAEGALAPVGGEQPRKSPKALWFTFDPRKKGPEHEVYISPEWEDLTRYCVGELVRYGDEVRHLVSSPEERELLILISGSTHTRGGPASRAAEGVPFARDRRSGTLAAARATALSYSALINWFNGSWTKEGQRPGILERWKITEDGTPDTPVYHLVTHAFRHGRANALSADASIPITALRDDLNHNPAWLDMQRAYQHTRRRHDDVLREKLTSGELVGPAVAYLKDLLGVTVEGERRFVLGVPGLMTSWLRERIAMNSRFMKLTRVRCGICALPGGPQQCPAYLACLEAKDGACDWFLTDAAHAPMILEIEERTAQHEAAERASRAIGRQIEAEKHAVSKRRSEAFQLDVAGKTPREVADKLAELRARLAAS
jgi:hypothetical protein